MCSIGLTTPCEIAFTVAILMLHILLTPSPQTIKDILLTELYCDHHPIRHSLGTCIMVFHVRYIPHRIAYLEINLVGATEYIVEYSLQFRVDIDLFVTHLHKEVSVLAGFKSTFFPRCERHHLDGQHHQ